MSDMSTTIVAKSDQLNADDLLSGPRTFTITRVDVRESGDQPVSVYLKEWPQPWKPSKTMRHVLVGTWGQDSSAYHGRRVTLWRNPDVKWSGQAVGGIEVTHASGIDKQFSVMLQVTRGQKKKFVVDPLKESAAVIEWSNKITQAADIESLTAIGKQLTSLPESERVALRGPFMERKRELSTVEPTDLNPQHCTYTALSQQIATVKSGHDAAELAQTIAGYLSSNEITQDQADELAERLRQEMQP